MTDLITIDELMSQAKTTRVHLAYLTKIGILPNAVKRKINGKLVGCYPKDSLTKLFEVKNIKSTGITYSQLAKQIPSVVEGPSTLADPSTHALRLLGRDDITIHVKPSNFAYLILGLVIGVLVSTLNTSGLVAMKETESLPLKSDVYLISVPKQNLDKLNKTTINYLIKN